MRFSSVYRGRGVDDSGCEEEEDIMLDSHNIETFGDSSDSLGRRPADLSCLQGSDGVRMPSSSSVVVVVDLLNLRYSSSFFFECKYIYIYIL